MLDHPASRQGAVRPGRPCPLRRRRRLARLGGRRRRHHRRRDPPRPRGRQGQPAPPRRHRAPGGRSASTACSSDPQLPFFIQWESPAEMHPSDGADSDFSLAALEIAGDPQRVSEWLGETVEAPLEDVKVEWVAPNGTPGIVARPDPDARPGSSGSDPSAAPRAGATAEPQHLAPPGDVRAREPRRRPRRPHRGRDARGRAWAGRTCSTSAAAPASTSPASRPSRRGGDRRRAAPRPGRARAASYPSAAERRGAAGHRRRRCRCRTPRSTSCTRGGRTSSARAASRAWPSSTGSYAAAARRS